MSVVVGVKNNKGGTKKGASTKKGKK